MYLADLILQNQTTVFKLRYFLGTGSIRAEFKMQDYCVSFHCFVVLVMLLESFLYSKDLTLCNDDGSE